MRSLPAFWAGWLGWAEGVAWLAGALGWRSVLAWVLGGVVGCSARLSGLAVGCATFGLDFFYVWGMSGGMSGVCQEPLGTMSGIFRECISGALVCGRCFCIVFFSEVWMCLFVIGRFQNRVRK